MKIKSYKSFLFIFSLLLSFMIAFAGCGGSGGGNGGGNSGGGNGGDGNGGDTSSWRTVKIEKDEKNDGTIDEVDTLTYDANGYLVKTEEDDGNDGTIDWVQTITYDTNGNLAKIEEDYSNDGTIDFVEMFMTQMVIWLRQKKTITMMEL